MSEHIGYCVCGHEPMDHVDAEGACNRCRCALLRINRFAAWGSHQREASDKEWKPQVRK